MHVGQFNHDSFSLCQCSGDVLRKCSNCWSPIIAFILPQYLKFLDSNVFFWEEILVIMEGGMESTNVCLHDQKTKKRIIGICGR